MMRMVQEGDVSNRFFLSVGGRRKNGVAFEKANFTSRPTTEEKLKRDPQFLVLTLVLISNCLVRN